MGSVCDFLLAQPIETLKGTCQGLSSSSYDVTQGLNDPR